MSLKRGSARRPTGRIQLAACFVSKLLLVHSHQVCYIFYGCLRVTVAELSNCDSDHVGNPKTFTVWTFIGKFVNP